MTVPASPAAVVFDLDGTLIDSIPDVVGALNRLLAEEGRRPVSLDEGRLMIGEGARPMVERAFAATGTRAADHAIADLTRRYIAFYRATPAADTIIYPGVMAVLDQLSAAGVNMGVCTNKPDEMSRLVLRELGMARYFSSVIGGGALPVQKPDARHLFAVLEHDLHDRCVRQHHRLPPHDGGCPGGHQIDAHRRPPTGARSISCLMDCRSWPVSIRATLLPLRAMVAAFNLGGMLCAIRCWMAPTRNCPNRSRPRFSVVRPLMTPRPILRCMS